MPPGAMLDPQSSSVALIPMLAFSSIGISDNSTRACPTQHAVFHWNIPITYGGYKGRHCFYATVRCPPRPARLLLVLLLHHHHHPHGLQRQDSCGQDGMCSSGNESVEICLDFQVQALRSSSSLPHSAPPPSTFSLPSLPCLPAPSPLFSLPPPSLFLLGAPLSTNFFVLLPPPRSLLPRLGGKMQVRCQHGANHR
eukprot:764502-Hanusia_phi.AAC.2